MDPHFAHIDDWLFDLDNCLYPALSRLFELIDQRMGAYIQRLLDCDPVEARRVQKSHFREHGTTLAGLMAEQNVDPHDFLTDVHDIPLDRIGRDDRLAAALERLPGRKIVFTNGDADYARRVLGAIGVETHFADVHDIHASAYKPKPDPHGYELLCERFGLDPARTLLADDMIQNLKPAKALGMTTVWVDNGSELGRHNHAEGVADETVTDLALWLETITAKE